MMIHLNSVNDIKDFVNIVSRFDDDIDVASKKTVLNAKSIMGLFCLDLSKPVEVKALGSQSSNVYDALSRFAS